MSEIAEACGGGDAGRPLVPGSLRGYRTWRPASRLGRHPDGMLPLTSVTRRHVVWTPTLRARCEPPDTGFPIPGPSTLGDDHPAPQPGCNCGIYGWYAPDDTGRVDARVFGAIEASGLVLMGERGFRAERARIAAVVTRNRRIAAACTRAGIAVYRRRRVLLRDYPPEDLSSLLGDRCRRHPGSWWVRWLASVDHALCCAGLCYAGWMAPPYAPPPWRSSPRPPASWPPPGRSLS
ncbi:MAG: hypothetical protein ACRD0W_00765 [Acidimicrobiales bacterium]